MSYFENLAYCPECDWAISKQVMDSLKAPLKQMLCPCCQGARMDQFYSFGSTTHRERRQAWERGELVGAPPRYEEKRI